MAIRKTRQEISAPSRVSSSQLARRQRLRNMLVEDLERRQLMAVGPQLIGIQPNNSDLIVNGSVLTETPRELVFRFDEAQVINASTLGGIQLRRAGGDGSFGLPSVGSDFGSNGAVSIQLTGRVPGQVLSVQVTRSDLGANAAPTFSVSGAGPNISVGITLNSNALTPTTGQQLVNAINASPLMVPVLGAAVDGGKPETVIGTIAPTYSPLVLNSSGDVVVQPGRIEVGTPPNQNEVRVRFAEALPNDLYRVQIFGFDDPVTGVVGLRNTNPNGNPGDLFRPTIAGTRGDTVDFRLDLGPQVTAVVPQPVVRNGAGALQQLRDTIVVYFDGTNKLLVENNALGQPTSRSAENPEFYQLFFNKDTVRNTDDQRYLPISVKYNATSNTATLRFDRDIDLLPGSNSGLHTFRLRVGTRETQPIAPSLSTAAATVISDFNTNGAVKFRFTARTLGEAGSGIRINVTNSNSGLPPAITASGTTINVDLGSNTVTAAQLLTALQASSASSSLVSVQLEPGSNAATVLNRPINFSPLQVVGLGDTFNTATDLGVIGSSVTSQTSLILSSQINPVPYNFDLIGAADDPGIRDTPAGVEQFINAAFGPDKIAGVTTINYNFNLNYGASTVNSITDKQKQRIREALQIWSDHLGVQFVETPTTGITIATGVVSTLSSANPNVVITNALNLGVLVDPAFSSSQLILDSSRQWGDNYGEDYFRVALTGIGMLLGLQRATDLPSGTLLALSTAFVNAGNSNTTPADEPVFPGSYDVVHGQHIFRPDSNDVDLYKFQVDFGAANRTGLFVAETYSERLETSSPLNSLLQLYKQQQATATSNLAAGESLQISFEAIKPGRLGNSLQIFVSRSARGAAALPIVNVFDNLITIDLNSTIGFETTAAQFVNALNTNPMASALVKTTLTQGTGTTKVGNRDITYSPITLNGGDIVLVARNDDYFSDDSFIQQSLSSGTYYVGVSSTGNESYDPTIPGTGFGGRTQGNYDLRVTFRAQVDSSDSIQNTAGQFSGDQPIAFDGDADGTPGGTYNFWFQTRPLDRTLNINAGASSSLEGQIVTITGANGVVRRFEFSSDANVGIGNTLVNYSLTSTAGDLANSLASAITSRFAELGVSAISNGVRLVLQGERTLLLSAGLSNIEVSGRMIFVDKSAGPNSDGTLAKPFNNIAGSGVANAFASAVPGDIVRIVGNGGGDGKLETTVDNFAYEIGFGLINSGALSDGSTMEVPKGVTTMIDAGAVFKLRRSRIGVGSSSLGVDRSNGALQVLGTPALIDQNGNLTRNSNGSVASGSVFFTSWLDESLGFDTYAPQTAPNVGDWGGISFRRDVDQSAGRTNLEDQGVFLQYVNHADIRFGGGGNVVIDSIQQVVQPIQIINMRPTVTFNRISNSADAAMSAAPNSFEETNFNEPRYQVNGSFTSDYDRVGPDVHHNILTNNSLNGLFVKVETPAGGAIRPLTVPARFDDIDIPYIISENIFISGTPGGSVVDNNKPLANFVALQQSVGGTLLPGTYNYRITYVDVSGYETPASDPTGNLAIIPGQTAIQLLGLPQTSGEYVGRRIYRSTSTGSGPYTLVAQLDATSSNFLDQGQTTGGVLSPRLLNPTTLRPRLDASLVIDPGAILKFEGARIEIGVGANLIAEGTDGAPVVFTSKLDDRYGAGGTFDTNNDSNSTVPRARDWGGIYASSGSKLSLDHAIVAFAGGVTKLEGTFKAFNPIEIQQADARIAHSTFEFNQDGIGGQGPLNRLGRLDNRAATIFVRGAQPILIGNTFLDNRGSAINIDANSMVADLVRDYGRSNGLIDRQSQFDSNRGPMIRENRMSNNQMNGLEVRGDLLTTESVWDDTDIVHVLFNSITVSNYIHEGGFRLQSSPSESLVVKLVGYGSNFINTAGTGITATGAFTNASDRVGGTVHILGQPGFPVIMTSFFDDTVGAGLQPDGNPQTDTNNDGIATIPRPADWRSIILDQFSNDRNVAVVMEIEDPNAVAPGFNSTTDTAQVLGDLASRPTASDESLRLGFVLKGVLSQPADVDVYSFTAEAGTEVWLDVDNTSQTLDTVIEILNASGNLLARSDNSTAETINPALITRTSLINPAQVNSLFSQTQGNQRTNASGTLKEDGTINPYDAGLRIVLPGTAGIRSTYHFRVRSSSTNIDNFNAGLTSGTYEVQVRTREAQEFPGSSIEYADIRYATNGVFISGLPAHSPLLGEAQENESAGGSFNNDVNSLNNVGNGGALGNRDQYVGNLLSTDRGVLSIGGELASTLDLDFYRFDVAYSNLNTVRATVVDAEPNDSIGGAQNLDDENWTTTPNPNIQNSTTRPHVTINGTGDGSYDYYSFTVTTPGATATFDIDGASFDTELFLFDTAGNLLAENDDSFLTDAGSSSGLDSFINFTFPLPGVYVIGVARFPSSAGAGGIIPGNEIRIGDSYLMHVSVDGKATASAATVGAPVVFDIDYADGLNRADTSLSVFSVGGALGAETYTLVYYGTDSNIADDQRGPLSLTDLQDFSRGSVGNKDPFIGAASLPAGTYSVAVSSSGRRPSALNNPNVRLSPLGSVLRVADESFEVAPSDAVLPRLFDRNLAPTSTNLWQRTTDFSPGHTGSSVFSFTGAGMTQPGGASGDLVSNAFSLGGYAASDLPKLYFSYNLNSEPGDTFQVAVRNSAGVDTVIAGAGLQTGQWLQSNLDLSAFAGQDNLRLVFRYNTNGTNGSTGSGVSIDNIIIGFAERGETVTGALPDSSFTGFGNAGTGHYQLEIRQVALDDLVPANSNSRSAAQVTLVAPEGRDLRTGDTFKLGDAGTQLTFEFTETGAVTPGNVAILFSQTDPDHLIARKIRDAINNPGVQSRINVRAATSGGLDSGVLGRDTHINLFGQVSGSFVNFSRPVSSILSTTTSGDALRSDILGSGISAGTQAAVYVGGNQSAGFVNFNGQSGIMLSTGSLATALPPNVLENSSGISNNTGDADTNLALGVTTTDATSLQMEFQFGNGTIGGDLFLDLVFLSEEYSENLAKDVVAVLVDGVNIALVPGTASPINASNINATNNPQLFYNNSLRNGGKYLDQSGFDGYTTPLSLSALGLSPGPHTLKVVVADTADKLGDSAVFIRSGSLKTTPTPRTYGGIQAIYNSGSGDQNTNRDQGQVIIQNNFIRHSRDYAIVTDAAQRLQDPRDNISLLAPGMGSNTPNPNDAMSSIPSLVNNYPGAVRNLRELNDLQLGGFNTGVVITNNVMESGGLGGVRISGENPIYMVTPRIIPLNDPLPTESNAQNPDHFGTFIDDSDLLVIDAGRTRVQFEFEDLSGAGTGGPTFGSGVVGGDGWRDQSVPIAYREDGGGQYLRLPNTTPGYSALEVLQSIRDSIFGSILVTNGSTDHIRATVAPSLQGRLNDGLTASRGYLNFHSSPALYLEGISNINFVNQNGGGNPFIFQRVDVADSPQPFVRVVNNTVYGNDGRASFAAAQTVQEPNDTIATAHETWQGTAHNPISFTMNAGIGDSSQFQLPLSQDVDLYQFKLNTGERVKVNIDTPVPGLDAVLQIFDASGRPQRFINSTGNQTTLSDNDNAPGETLGLDPYIDFTATKPGVYYAAVSAKGNSNYDPLSLGNRVNGNSTGAYTINLSVLHPQDFTITVQDQSAYPDGSTFTIFQVPDLANTNNNGVTFEFTRGGGAAAGNIPIRIDASYRAPDVARAIAGAINGLNSGGPRLPNAQTLNNGTFGNASPLNAVEAEALGGIDGVEAGLTLYPRRIDGIQPTHSGGGIGHDRTASGATSNTSRGDGTTERFVVIRNAAFIRSNGTVRVDPDINANNNLDQILPETGILVSQGATPTLMNNAFVNVQTPIIREETRVTNPGNPIGSRTPAPFNTASDVHPKRGEVIIGGSLYQYAETAAALNRSGFGIEASPTNLPGTGLDFNTTVPSGVRVFVNAQASQFLPANQSPLIDSSLDSLEEREAFKTIKQAMGIALSPVRAPARDASGQLRVDDPNVATPSGLGANVFKDRGALDRADFVGPSAQASRPLDNDSSNVDSDKTTSVIQLTTGVYPEFRIQLVDGFEAADPFPGIGIDDATVVGPDVPGVRRPGAAITLFENGRLLTEGIDYRFSYDQTTNEIILTPLAGVWQNDRVYEIGINNKDRFVLTAPSGDQVSDGDFFTITDANGGTVFFEYDSGYRLQVPQGLTLQIPLAGGATGGVADGDRFIINTGTQTVTFEFDRNGNFLSGNRQVPFIQGASQAEIAQAIITAIQNSGLPITPRLLNSGTVFLGAENGVRLDTTFTVLSQPATTFAFKIPDLGPRPGGIVEGQTFTISDGLRTLTFEYDTDATVQAGNTPLNFTGAVTVADLAVLTAQGLANSSLNVKPQVIGTDLVYLGLGPNGTASVGTSRLALLGVSRSITDGQSFTVSANGITRTFEFTRDANVTAGNVGIPVSLSETQAEIGVKIANAIKNAGLGLSPVHISDGNISVGGQISDSINVALAPSLGLFGVPGVRSNTRLQVFGPLLLNVPSRGAADITDGTTFRISNGGTSVIFEFDNNFSGPSLPGNVIVRYTAQSTANDIALALVNAIGTAGLGIIPANLGGGVVSLGGLQTNQVLLLSSNLSLSRGVVNDGETFSISNGTRTVVFEFENATIGNGFVNGNVPILFTSVSTPDTLTQSMKAAIEGAGLGLTTTVLPNGTIELNDTPRFTTDSRGAPTLIKSGVPGGATPVFFSQDTSFDGAAMKRAMIDAINSARNTTLTASDRGGASLFVEGAISIGPQIQNYFLRGVADLSGNLLKPNRINNETQFTILMPGVELDYGDAPDPFTTTSGRYSTLHESNGARHVLGGPGSPLLGATATGERDGLPTPSADGDAGDNGVTFSSPTFPVGLFNRNIFTTVTVTLSSPGSVDGWIDFNADGDWDDPGERILNAVRFNETSLTQSFQIQVPATAPVPATATKSFARFRSSSTGGLVPTGLTVDGEVEDYAITIVPGTPPRAVNDTYSFNEDSVLTTTDAYGLSSPGFVIDDGIAANDVDPEGGPLFISLLTAPANAAQFTLNNDGTFTYRPAANFFGTDTFTYRVNDGVLTSNNVGTVTINIQSVNDAPIGNPDSLTTDEDVVIDISESVLLANDRPGPTNESGQAIQITGVSPVSVNGGSVSLVNGRVIFIPNSNFSGTDQFTYTVTDNGTTNGIAAPMSSVVTVTVTVLDKNDPPITVPKTASVVEDTPLTLAITTLTNNDLPGPPDEAGQTITFDGVVAQSTNGGTVVISGNNVIYTPPADFNGLDTFFYRVRDNGTSGGVSDPQSNLGTVTVQVTGVNDTPRVANPIGTVTMTEDASARTIDLSQVFRDPDVVTSGDSLTYRVVSSTTPTLANATISGSQLTLQLLADQNGQSVIVVEAKDSLNQTVLTTFTLSVTPQNDAPRLISAIPDRTVVEDAAPITFELSPAHFFDPDVTLNGDQLRYTVVSNSNTLLVTPTFNGNQVTLTLGANRNGSSVLVIQAADSSNLTITDTFTLTVTPINDAPTTVDDSYIVSQGTALITTDPRGISNLPNTFGVLANDSDPEGTTLTATMVTAPQFASQFSLNTDGTFTYRHNGASRTTDTFTYRASDGGLTSRITTVTISIDPPPRPLHQNPTRLPDESPAGHRDVNADGFISPIDALLVINFINQNGAQSVSGLPAPPPYLDVSGDNFIAPLDALLVINYLNENSGGGEGEGLSLGYVQTVVSSNQDNARFGLRAVPEELPVGGACSAGEYFADLGDGNPMVDTSWLVARAEEEENVQEIPIDLALASLMPDLDQNGGA